MENAQHIGKGAWKAVLLQGLVFLLFFQLVSDFIESIYAFGLLGTSIPSEIAAVVLFFSPLVLLAVRRGLSRRAVAILIGAAALLRALEVSLSGSGRLLASGAGVGCVFLLLPLLLTGEEHDALEMGGGLALGLSFSILLRALAAGSEAGLVYPILSWTLAVLTLTLLVFQEWTPPNISSVPERLPASFGESVVCSIGLMGVLAVLYFAFVSPTVLARWVEADYRLVLLFLAAALGLYLAALSGGWLAQFPKRLLLVWNALFLLAGVSAIRLSQVNFPAEISAYPLDQPPSGFWQMLLLFAMIMLSPVVLLNFLWLTRELRARKISPGMLGGSFALSSLFLLVVVFAQAFTVVYDYIPVVGPWFRDRFWLVFLLAGLGMTLPLLWVKDRPSVRTLPALSIVIFPLGLAALLTAVITAVMTSPRPIAPPEDGILRVVTYNVQQGYSADGRRAYDEQLAVLRELQPDMVGLQESDVARFSGGNADIVRTFSEGLNMYSYYGPRTVTGTFGIALLSRYPVQNPRTFFMYSVGEQTAAIEAEVVIAGIPYHVLVTHLGNDGPIVQQRQVLERLAGWQNVIAMGDFNFEPTTEQYALTLQLLADAWVLAGSQPARGFDPQERIDYIFVSPQLTVQSARYMVSPASDHPALVAEIVTGIP